MAGVVHRRTALRRWRLEKCDAAPQWTIAARRYSATSCRRMDGVAPVPPCRWLDGVVLATSCLLCWWHFLKFRNWDYTRLMLFGCVTCVHSPTLCTRCFVLDRVHSQEPLQKIFLVWPYANSLPLNNEHDFETVWDGPPLSPTHG